MNPPDDLSVIEIFSSSEIAYYIRHILQSVPFQDLSLMDTLIHATERDFTSAVGACIYMRFGLNNGPDDLIQILLHSRVATQSLSDIMLHHTLKTLDGEILAELKEDASFSAIVSSRRPSNWPQLYELHRRILHICLRTMTTLLRFNICSIPSSYIRNDHPSIQQLVQNAKNKGDITSALAYACSHWAHHASFVLSDVTDPIIKFLESHALHWLEILSLNGQDAASTLRPLSSSHVSR